MKFDLEDASFGRRWLASAVHYGLPIFWVMWILSYRPFSWATVFLCVTIYLVVCPFVIALIMRPLLRYIRRHMH